MRDCFVMLTTSKGNRGDRMKNLARCAKFFNENVVPTHKDVPLIVFSEGEDDLHLPDRAAITKSFACPVEFWDLSLQPPADLGLPDPSTWHRIKYHGVGYRGMCWLFSKGLGDVLRDKFDYVCRIDDDSYFLSPIEKNFFDRLREEDAWYAYRGLYPEPDHQCVRMVELLKYDGLNDHGVGGLRPQAKIDHAIFTNFFICKRELFDSDLFAVLEQPEIKRQHWTHRWGDNAVHTALLSKAPEGKVKLWTDFKYGHGPLGPRYHMALGDGPTFWQPHRWPADNDGNIDERAKLRKERMEAAKKAASADPAKRPARKGPVVLDKKDRNKAIVVIGDGLGNVVAQTPLVRAATELFEEVHVWMPRSRPDLPDIIRDMPRVQSVNTQWIDAFNNPDAILQTWLVAPKANSKKPGSLLARYESKNPRGTGRNEMDVCMDAARKAGWKGDPLPEPYVGWDEWPNRDECTNDAPIFGFTTGRLHRPMWRFKEYPAELYAKAIDIISAKIPGAKFLQIGWEHDTKIPHELVRDTRRRGTLRQSLGLVRCCTVFCGNDTGLCWAANAMNVPTVVVFGPTDPVKCLPPWRAVAVAKGLDCQPCQWRGMGKLPGGGACNHECMTELEPERVAQAILTENEIWHAQKA